MYIATHIARGIPSFPKQRRRCWMWKLCKIQGWLHLFEKQSYKPTRSLQSDANIAGCVVLHAEGYTRWAEHSVFQPQSLIMLEFPEGLTVKKGGNSLETVRLNSSSTDQCVLHMMVYVKQGRSMRFCFSLHFCIKATWSRGKIQN